MAGAFFSARIRRNLGFKLLGTVIEKGLRLALTMTAARMLGTAAWGRYGYALALATLTVQLIDLGLNLFAAREIAREEDSSERADFVGQVFALKALLGGGYVLVMAALAIAHLDEPVVAAAIALCGLAALSNAALEAMVHVFRGVQDLALEARCVTAYAVAQLTLGLGALLLAALYWGRSLDAVPGQAGEAACLLLFCAAMAAAALVAVIYAYGLLRRVTRPRLGLSATMAARFRREVLPLGIAIVASLIYYRIDVPMIRMMRGDVDTGLYTASYKILEYGAMVPAMLMAATFPALSEAVGRSADDARRLHSTAMAWLVAAGTVGTICLWLMPELIVGLLYGERFAASAPMLQALAPCLLLTYVNFLLTHMLVVLGLVRQQMLISIALIGLNVGLNWWLIPQWGGVGAAWATAATETALLLFCAPLVWFGLRRLPDASAPAEATP